MGTLKHKVEEHMRDKDINLEVVLVSREETLDLWIDMAGSVANHKVIRGIPVKLLVVIKEIRDKHLVHQADIQEIQDQCHHNNS